MIRFILFLLLLIIAGAGYMFYSAQAVPEWSKNQQSHTAKVQKLQKQIQQQGTSKFLGDKFAQVMNGRLVLDDAEFTALVMASLLKHKNGRRLLSVADSIDARSTESGLQVNTVINLEKLEKADAHSKEALEKITKYLPASADQKLYLSVRGKPIARNGQIALGDDFSISIGTMTLATSTLKQLGLPLHKLSKQSLPLKNLRIKSITTRNGEVEFGVAPRF